MKKAKWVKSPKNSKAMQNMREHEERVRLEREREFRETGRVKLPSLDSFVRRIYD